MNDGLPSIPSRYKRFNENSLHGKHNHGHDDHNNFGINLNIRTFMATIVFCTVSSNLSISSEPLLDDGAPFSFIGMTDLRLLWRHDTVSAILLDANPSSLSSYEWWKFGTGIHASDRRKILGSINLTATYDSHNKVQIRHLVID